MNPKIVALLRFAVNIVPTRKGRLRRDNPSPWLPERIVVIATVAISPQSTRLWQQVERHRSLLLAPLGACQRQGSEDHADMREGLREVAQLTAVFRIDLLGEQSEIVRQRDHVLEHFSRGVDVATADEVVDGPERADAERALARRQAVDVPLISI